MQPRALIVGAGLSGLSAAIHLREAGWQVKLTDSSDRPGGRARTEAREGFLIDTGPDALSTGYTDYQRMAARLGLADEIVPSSPVLGMVRNGRLIDIDSSKLLRAMFTPALSIGAKLRFARGAWKMRHEIGEANAFELVAQAADDDPTVSAYDVAERAFGREVATYLIDPLVRLVTGTDSRHATGLAVRAVLSAWSAPMINVLGGVSNLPRRMAQGLDIDFGATVGQVERDRTGVTAIWRTADGTTRSDRFDAAVIATQIDAAIGIAPDIKAAIGDLEPRIGPLSLMTISLAFDKPTASRAYAVQLPSVEHPDELVMFLQHNKAPDRAPPGKSLISYYIDHRSADRWFALQDSEITRRAIAFVTGLMPELTGSFRFAHITRWPRAGSLADPGYYRAVQEITRRLPDDSPIQLAGDFYSAGSMETALRTGRKAAERLITRAARRNSGGATADA